YGAELAAGGWPPGGMVPGFQAVQIRERLVRANEHLDRLVRLAVRPVVEPHQLWIVRPLPRHDLEVDASDRVVVIAQLGVRLPEVDDVKAGGQTVAQRVIVPDRGDNRP